MLGKAQSQCSQDEKNPVLSEITRVSATVKPKNDSFQERTKRWLEVRAKKLQQERVKLYQKRAEDELKECLFQPILKRKHLGGEQCLQQIKGTGLHLYRQNKARSLKSLQSFKQDNPNWYVWNHRNPPSVTKAEQFFLGRTLPNANRVPNPEYYQ